jgi:hypothetical protein
MEDELDDAFMPLMHVSPQPIISDETADFGKNDSLEIFHGRCLIFFFGCIAALCTVVIE